MHIEVSGADFKAFLNDGAIWHQQTYWDDTRIGISGSFDNEELDYAGIADDAVVRIESGFLEAAPSGVPQDLIECMRWWLSRQQSVKLVVTVPLGAKERVIALLNDLGAVVGGAG